MRRADMETICRIAVALLIGFLFIYLIYSMSDFSDGNAERQVSSIEEIIDKALVQCYALEGAYPLDVEYVSRYGVLFNKDKYEYYYEWYGSNLKPTVIVIEK